MFADRLLARIKLIGRVDRVPESFARVGVLAPLVQSALAD